MEDRNSLFQKMVKIYCLFLLVLIAFSCESKKKGKKKASSGYVPSWLRTPAPKPTPSSQSGVSYKVKVKQGFRLTDINSTEMFYEVFKLPRLPQHRNQGRPHAHGSSGGCHPILSAHCSPRPTYVRLPDPPFGKSYFPKGVLIDQCSGFCFYEGLTCLGVAFRNVTKDIFEITWSDRNYGMSGRIAASAGLEMTSVPKQIVLKEPTQCQCGCAKTANDCTDAQQFDSSDCSCKCKPPKKPVRCADNWTFDSNTCKCVCAVGHRFCGQRRKWDREECKCKCRTEIRCNYPYKRDEASCQCVNAFG